MLDQALLETYYAIFFVSLGAEPQKVDPSGSYSGRKRRQTFDEYDYEQTETGKDFSCLVLNRLISTGLELVLSYSEKHVQYSITDNLSRISK